ncbi:MAG TPA: hypothetical protein DCP90_05420 [Clostridiales bacterium]|nr:MAG: hypothetical protein A2Y22_05555 [Clostridiales bacterium GWD2_32_59]HAN10040.1 hypothetical protein [Clostridiales bacterium]
MKKEKGLKVLLLVVLLGIAIYGSYAMFQGGKTYIKIEDDFDKLGNAYISTMLLKSYEVNQELKYEVVSMKEQASEGMPSNEDIKNLIAGFKLNVKTIKSQDDKYNMNLDLMLDNTSFVKLDAYVDNDMLVLDMPGIYTKKMYIKYTDINKILKKIDPSITEEINIDDYRELFAYENLGKLKEVDALSYYKLLKNKLKDGFKNEGKANVAIIENGKERAYSCENYELTLNQKQMLETTKEVLNKLISDEKVKLFAKDKMNEIFDILVKTEDYKLLNSTLEEITKAKEDFNKDYDKNYEEFAKGFNEGFEKMLTESTAQISDENKIKYNFAVDGDHNIRKINAEQITKTDEITLKMLMSATTANPNKEIKVVAPDLKDAVNLAELTDEQYREIGTQIYLSITGKAMQSPSIQKTIMPFMMGQQPGAIQDVTPVAPTDGVIAE